MVVVAAAAALPSAPPAAAARESHHHHHHPPPATKFATLAASTLIDACSGVSYSFSVWAPHMRRVLDLDQTRIAAAGAWLNLGGYFALPAGALYDALSHRPSGPRQVLYVGAFCCFAGYAGLFLLSSGRLAPSYGVLLFFAALAGNSGVWLDASVLVTNVRNFEQDRGTVVGVLKAFLGLSASLWALPYAALLEPDVDAYLLLLALAPAAIIVAASLVFGRVPFVEACELEEAGAAAAAGGGDGGGAAAAAPAEDGAAAASAPYTLLFPASSSSSLPPSLRLRQARARLAQRLRAALYLPPARRFRAAGALVASLAVFQTAVALVLHDEVLATPATKRALFAAALVLLACVSSAPWATAGMRLRAEPAAALLLLNEPPSLSLAAGDEEQAGGGGGGGAKAPAPAAHHRRERSLLGPTVEMAVRQHSSKTAAASHHHRPPGLAVATAAGVAAAAGGGGGAGATTAASAAPLAAASLDAGGDGSDAEDGVPLLSAAAAGGAAGSPAPAAAGTAAAAPLDGGAAAATSSPPASSASEGLLAAVRMAASAEGALLLLQFAVVSGACLGFLNNLGEVYQSLAAGAAAAAAASAGRGGTERAKAAGGGDGDSGGHVLFVSLFSVANAVGRLAGGAAPEAALRRHGTPRPLYLAATTLLVALAAALAAAGAAEGGATLPLAALSAAFGFAFGSTWSLVPAILADVFGLHHFAQNYAIAQLAPAAGGFLLASGLVGRLYDRAAAAQALEAAAKKAAAKGEDSPLRKAAEAAGLLVARRVAATHHRCAGSACFSAAFWALSGLCAVAALTTLLLARRTRALYGALGRELRAAHAARRARGAGKAATGGGGGGGGGEAATATATMTTRIVLEEEL